MSRQKLKLNKNKQPSKSIRQYIEELDIKRREVFYSELVSIAIAYFMGTDWDLTKVKISNRYPDNIYGELREYILKIDKQVITAIADDFIQFYQKKQYG